MSGPRPRVTGGLADSLRAMFVKPPSMEWEKRLPPFLEGVYGNDRILVNPFSRVWADNRENLPDISNTEPVGDERNVLMHEVAHAKQHGEPGRYQWPSEELRMGQMLRTRDPYAKSNLEGGSVKEYDAQAMANALRLLQDRAPYDSVRAADDSIPGTESLYHQAKDRESVYAEHPARWGPGRGGRETLMGRLAQSLGMRR